MNTIGTLTFTFALALAGIGCASARPPAVGGTGDFFIQVEGAGDAMTIRWDGGAAAGVDVKKPGGGHMWFVTSFNDGMSSPVTFGVTPEGASVNTEKTPLEKGTTYVVDIVLLSGETATQTVTP